MTTTTHETEIVIDPDVPLVRITREFDAPPDQVFRAHVDPELFARWNGPVYLSTRLDQWDVRTGGSYRYVMEADGDEHEFYGCFHEVRPNELLVQTFTYAPMPDGIALEKLRFIDLGDGRTRLEATSLVDSFEERDAFVASGMEQGVVEGYQQLDAVLAEG